MSILNNLILKLFKESEIIYKADLSTSAIHIRIQCKAIKQTDYVTGNFLRMVFKNGNNAFVMEKVRSYSVWNIDKNKGEIDIAIATHGKGIGTESAKKCEVGESLFFNWHKSKFTVDNSADSYLFIGDLSALGQLYEINRNLSVGKTIESIVYSQQETDFFADINGQNPFDFYALPENPSDWIIQKLSEKLPKLNGKKTVYIAGDSRVCVALTNYFRRELKWDSKSIKTKVFWNPDKKGLE